MAEQLSKMNAVTSSTNARKAAREEVKSKKSKKEKEKISQRIERLTLEMDAKTLEAGEMGNALESVYERLRFFEKRFQQIAAATGLTDPDALINKFLLKEEMKAELTAAAQQKLQQIEQKEKEKAELLQAVEAAREQYRDSKWKDVDQWEERYRTLEAHASQLHTDADRLNQRLAFFQEGLVTILNALPPMPVRRAPARCLPGATRHSRAHRPFLCCIALCCVVLCCVRVRWMNTAPSPCRNCPKTTPGRRRLKSM